ncbi:MAG: S8 family serine peptidase [Bacteroidota bacterium]
MRRLQCYNCGLPFTIFALLFSFSLTAQDNYYWSDNRKIEIVEDQTAVSIQFFEKQNEQVLKRQLQNNKAVQSFEYQAFSKRLLVHFYQEIASNKILPLLNFKELEIKEINFAQRLKDGFPLWLTNRVVLKLSRGKTLQDLENTLSSQIAKITTAPFEAYQIIELENAESTLTVANQLRESGIAKWSHPDFYAKKTKYIDPLYADQFQLNNTGQTVDRFQGVNDIDCNAPEAWTITKGDENLIVAVIDDGVEAHEDLVDANGNSSVLEGYAPFTNGDGTPLKREDGHGQSCAGIIAAAHNDIGVRGIAPNVKILPINIFAGEETLAQIANAFNFARINNAAVLSNSWGYSTCEGRFDVIDQAIANVVNNGREGKGAIVTFASGNSYADCVEYPANLSNVIGVGAVTNRGLRSDYSNYGNTLDLVAPSNGAAGVRTIDRMGFDGYSNGNYTGNFGGTSAACPVVSGVAALVISAAPDLTGAQITNILLNTAVDMGDAGRDNEHGYGRVNAYDAILAATGGESFGYCSSQGQSVADEWIGGFAFGDYSNSSNATTYSDFTDEKITAAAGETYDLTITPEYSGQRYPDAFRVWIDYNQNEQFDDDELVFEAGPTNQEVSGTITIPNGLTGSTRLRVALKFESFSDACEIFEYGEVEDYTVVFQEGNAVACEPPIGLDATDFEDGNATLRWVATSSSQNYGVRVRVNGGDWIDFEEINGTNIILTNFVEEASYEFAVRSNCGGNNSSIYSNTYSFVYSSANKDTYCGIEADISQYQWIDLVEINEISNPTGNDGGYADYTDLVADIQRGKTETIYISKGPSTEYVFNWNIYIDYDQNGVFDVEELMVQGTSESNETLYAEFEVPAEAQLGQTRLRVILNYDEGSSACGTFEYGEVEDYTVNIRANGTNFNLGDRGDALALKKSDLQSDLELIAFPNPTTAYLQLQSNQFFETAKVNIFDSRGSLVLQVSNWTNGEPILVRNLAAGLYYLKIQTEKGGHRLSFVKK